MKLLDKLIINMLSIIACLSALIATEPTGQQQQDNPSIKSSKLICLMNEPSESTLPEWIDQFNFYNECKGCQKGRLEYQGEYTRCCIRFVEDMKKMNVGYGMLTKNRGIPVADLRLSEETYKKAIELGTFIKILLGYLKNLDQTKETLTPDGTNVFIPHISFVIQWNENETPQLVPAGLLQDDNGASITFMSGTGEEYYKQRIEEIYNFIYKEDNENNVVVYSGRDVIDRYAPYILAKAVKQEWYKSTLKKTIEVLNQRISTLQNAQEEAVTAKEYLITMSQFLINLSNNQLNEAFQSNQSCVQHLQQAYGVKEDKVNVSNITIFENAALNFLDTWISKFSIEEKMPIATLIFYIRCILNPEILIDLQQSKTLWMAIKYLADSIKCKNPDSESEREISMAQRIIKYGLLEFNDSHTEPLFIKQVKSNPQLLIMNMDRVLEDNKHRCLPSSKPRFLGVMVDAFSWLDVCSSCGPYLNTNSLWIESLQDIKEPIASKGFDIPFQNIDSLFRIVSQKQYDLMPINLNGAGGGSKYAEKGYERGWDFRVLSEMRYTLATRCLPTDSLIRDRVISKIPTTLASASHKKTEEFWNDHLPIFFLGEQSSSINRVVLAVLDTLLLRFPENISFKIKKVILEEKHREMYGYYKSNYQELHNISLMILSPLCQMLPTESNVDRRDIQIVRTCFTKSGISRINALLEEKKLDDINQCLVNIAKYGLVYGSNLAIEDYLQAKDHVTSYWANQWKYGSEWTSDPYFDAKDKDNAEALFNLMKKL